MRPLAARPRAVTVRRLLMDSLLRRPLLVADATMATRTADVLDWLRSASTA